MAVTAQYAGFGRRLVAVLLDGLIIGVADLVLSLALGTLMGGGRAYQNFKSDQLGGNLVFLVVYILYVVVYQSNAGQTFGKKLLGVKVVDSSGKTPSLLIFLLRETIGKWISGLVLLVGYLMVLWDGKKQGLHDKIASTYVIRV